MDKRYKKILWRMTGPVIHAANRLTCQPGRKVSQVIRFNTALQTDNLGDEIIMRACRSVLDDLFPGAEFIDIPTHVMPDPEQEQVIRNVPVRVVCGTNLLTSHIENRWNWILPDGLRRKLAYRNVLLLGCGWKNYEEDCSDYSRMIYQSMLNPKWLHSVRDSYTEEKLKKIGICNVLNTGCPTMWQLTEDFCQTIPCHKAENVVTTLTDYRRDAEADQRLLTILSKNYEHVFLWLQGNTDEDYLNTLNIPDNLTILPAKLETFENRLEEGGVDYIGTRLHAGIFALNHHIRSLVISVDNRAVEIAKDTGLPVLARKDIENCLESRIYSDEPVMIHIPQDNIRKFKAQFEKWRGHER